MMTLRLPKKLLCTCLLGLGFATSAGATGYTLDTSVSAGNFSEQYTFSIATGTTGDLTGTLLNGYDIWTTVPTPALGGVYVSSITLSSGSLMTTHTTVDDDILGDQSLIGYTSTFNFSATGLSAGTYTLAVNGKAFTDSNYTGAFAVTTTPVPEPEAYSMLMLGLGLVGLAGYRRKSI